MLSGEGTSLTNLDLNYGDEVTCTFTNNKRPLVKVVKNLEPEEDEGRFDLLISGYDPFTNGGAGFGDGGTTDFQDVDPGQVVVGEAGHGATKLSSYFLSVDCGPKGGSETDSEYAFEVAYGDEVTCVITNERRPSSIYVTKTPSPSSKPEPGGTFTYTVTVENTSDADEVTLNAASFVERVAKNTPVLETSPVVAITDLDCNGDAPEGEPDNGDGLPVTLAIDGPDSMITCTFTGENTGNAGDVFNDRITVTGKDEANRDVKAYAKATVNLTNVPASITIVKTATPTTVAEPGGDVMFTFTITNTSTVDSVTIDSLVDTIYGDLAVKPNV